LSYVLTGGDHSATSTGFPAIAAETKDLQNQAVATRIDRVGAGTCGACPDTRIKFGPLSFKGDFMNLTRILFIALAIALPASWTVAKAEDAPPAEGTKEKTKKKGKKKSAEEGEKKDDKKM
jgi:hypothetical protein